MREIEARWIKDQLASINADELSPLIEIGSSTHKFRVFEKPHIEREVHAPLRDRGVRIVTTDLKSAEGVDIPGDIYDPNVQKKLLAVKANALMVCNIFEHLTDRKSFAQSCLALIGDGGRVIVTVPYDFPYHLDPIDTMFRPTPNEILDLFPQTVIEAESILVDGTWWLELRKKYSLVNAVLAIIKEIIRALLLRGGLQRSLSRVSRLKFLFRPYRISAVILKIVGPTKSNEQR